ncbi:MAG: OmpH family outer membrane protein [Bacteroidales bacterium]|nr:OmpH family outer membrane protein [Bacteroidales bacterium]
MKKIFTLTLIAAAMLAAACNTVKKDQNTASEECSCTCKDLTIAFFDLDRVIAEYDMANDLRSTVEAKVAGIQKEIDKRGSKLENDIADWQDKVSKGLMTRSTAEAQGQKLDQRRNEFQEYAAQKQQEIMEEQQVMMNQIGDAIQNYVDKYNEDKQYSLILTNQGNVPVIAGDASLNITDEIIAGLNEEYVKNKK